MVLTVQNREAYINSCFVVSPAILLMNEVHFLLTSLSLRDYMQFKKKDNQEFKEKAACRKAQHVGLIYRYCFYHSLFFSFIIIILNLYNCSTCFMVFEFLDWDSMLWKHHWNPLM